MAPRWHGGDPDTHVRVRPSRRGSRPRTKDRPSHTDAVPGWVIAVDRGRYHCQITTTTGTVVVTAMTARELGRGAVVVGDAVALVGDISGTEGSLARIVRVEPRRTELRRSRDDAEASTDAAREEKVVVANADQVMLVVAATDPPPRPGMIDRCLVGAQTAGVPLYLLITKTDLDTDAFDSVTDLRRYYEPLGVQVLTVGFTPDQQYLSDDLAAVQQVLAHQVSVLLGHSGVGKSTLMNALVPDAERATGAVNDVTGRGRHTSTSAVALPLLGGGWLVDTPGVRSFGLAHVPASDVVAAFTELAPLAATCPSGCRHAAETERCALVAAAAANPVGPLASRVASLQRILAGKGKAVQCPE